MCERTCFGDSKNKTFCIFLSLSSSSVSPVVPRDGSSPRGNQSHHPGGEPGPAVPRHPDGRQAGQGALRAGGGGVCERREVSRGTGRMWKVPEKNLRKADGCHQQAQAPEDEHFSPPDLMERICLTYSSAKEPITSVL